MADPADGAGAVPGPFGVVAGVVLVVWMPIEVGLSYREAFLAPGDEYGVIRASNLLSTLALPATGSLYAVAGAVAMGMRPTLGAALRFALSNWLRLFLVRFVTGLAVLIGLVLLVVPGIYVAVRIAMAEPVAVEEQRPVSDCIV